MPKRLLLLPLLLAGCAGGNLESENLSLRRKVELLEARNRFLEEEVERLAILDGSGAISNSPENRELLCGGVANFLCPDGFSCLGKGEEEGATGTCVKEGEEASFRAEKEEEGREKAAVLTPSNIQNQTSNIQLPCGVLGEKLNRNPLLGEVERICCAPLVENRVSKSYSICAEGNGSATVAPEPIEKESTASGGPRLFGERAAEESAEEESPAVSATPKTQDPIPNSQISFPPVDNSLGWQTFSSSKTDFTFRFPRGFYFASFGAAGGNLWQVALATTPPVDESGEVSKWASERPEEAEVRVLLKTGAAESEELEEIDGGWRCRKNLDGGRFVEALSKGTPPDGAEFLCRIAESAR